MKKQDVVQITRFRSPQAKLIALKMLAKKGKITITAPCKATKPAV